VTCSHPSLLVAHILRQANEAYRPIERSIPSVPPPQTQAHTRTRPCTHSQHVRADTQEATFARADLAHAVVLAQVDRKFVLCALQDGTLLLFDQHAASERVRVECFLQELCEGFLGEDAGGGEGDSEGAWAEVRPPAPVLLPRREVDMLRGSGGARAELEKWGFGFASDVGTALALGNEEDTQEQIFVGRVPAIVSHKVSFPAPLVECFSNSKAS
jgi:hypothetical protein